MLKREYFDLYKADGTRFYYVPELLTNIKSELNALLSSEPGLHTLDFAKSMMFSHEIKYNNQVEGYRDDVTIIEKAINNASTVKDYTQRMRILNLYRAYKHILALDKMDKDELKKLYAITSDGLLEERDRTRMGEYYRNDKNIILKCGRLDTDYHEEVPFQELDRFMNAYFDFLNNNISGDETDEYIKSQILHFYFVYVHPYFDVNGRTSRTIAMWYLLNKRVYPYIIFNRGISFKGYNYDRTIMKSIEDNNMTHFLMMTLETVRIEFEKEYIIDRINEKTKLSPQEYQSVLYLLSMNGLRTIFDFATMYNSKNDKLRVKEVYENMILPLLDKGVLDVVSETKKEKGGVKNKVLQFRTIDIDKEKIKHISL